ncbi:MAG: hypothetical protein HON90_03925 [Halobacteriovoraceae bacterium]|jgi:hypothetical protein|nr:hypothetical protein [Halobacteriovoraceae bacterium]
MLKLLEVEINEEVKRSLLIVYAFSTLTFAMFLLTRVTLQNFFEIGFFIEFAFVFLSLRFYARAHRNRNYAFWGVSLVLAVYILLKILHFTFIDYNIFILYVSFLCALFLGINGYIMISPLYFPMVQWWEYDFRYRGDLVAKAEAKDQDEELRIADIRRGCVSILSFKSKKLGDSIKLEIPFGSRVFIMRGQVKTLREDIPGRPIRYGIKLDINTESEKKEYLELKKIWSMHNKARIRRKFADYKESESTSEV